MEQRVDQFVANNFSSTASEGKIKVITGPNISGKSVYLKQVALIVFMAHLGSYVPAQSAVIGPVDDIFTCIWSKESISTGLSSFMVDINMMFRACREASPRSLVIVDEFGKGTEMTDGLALLAACVTSFIELGARSPHALFSTHFHEMVQQNLLPSSPCVKYQMMNVVEMENELVLLYKLVDGSATFSHALHVAARMGLDDEIIERAADVTQRLLRQENMFPDLTEREKRLHDEAMEILDEFFQLDLETENYSIVEKFLERVKEPGGGPRGRVEMLMTSDDSGSESDYVFNE